MTHDNPPTAPLNHEPEDEAAEAAPPAEASDEAAPGPRRQAAPAWPLQGDALRKPAAATAAKAQPSFVFSASGEQLTREELLARYRRQRGLPEDPFENGARPVPPPGYRDRIMNEPRPARFLSREAVEEPVPAARPARSFTLGQTIAIASTMALVAGAGAGVVGARFFAEPARRQAAAPVAGAAAAQPAAAQLVEATQPQMPAASQIAQAPAGNATTIDKKPVATATLQVEDVTGQTNSFIPLALHAEPGGLDKDILLKISGVPENAYLTSGHREDGQIWALSLAETKDVKLMVPQAKNPEIDLAVAAFEPKTGELAAPVKTMTVALSDVVVEPTSAPPPGQQPSSATDADKSALPGAAAPAATIGPAAPVEVAAATPETPQTEQLIKGGNRLLGSGDVSGARKSFERAWGNDGSADAAFGLARSYDPLVLASLTAGNAQADKDQALQWYQRAAAGGNPDAAEAIVRLQMKP